MKRAQDTYEDYLLINHQMNINNPENINDLHVNDKVESETVDNRELDE